MKTRTPKNADKAKYAHAHAYTAYTNSNTNTNTNTNTIANTMLTLLAARFLLSYEYACGNGDSDAASLPAVLGQ